MQPEKPLAFLIEDDEDLAAIFCGALDSAGFLTRIFKNGQQALDGLTIEAPEVVILDLHLPLISGQEVLAYIRAQKRLAFTNVVVTTADAILADEVKNSADMVLIKPITFSQLRDLTARLNPFEPED
jgi:CheY-like chemotaxis protein